MRIKLTTLFLLSIILTGTLRAQEIQQVSILDISSDFGVPASFIQDTNVFISQVTTQNDNYLSKASICANISTRTQSMLITLKTDYKNVDGLIMLSSTKAIFDFSFYETKLQQLSITAARYSQYYLALEQTRINISAAEALATEEAAAQQRQSDLNLQAKAIKDDIDILHDSITGRCLHNKPSDKNLAKEYKDLYYAYMAIYNQNSSLPSQSSEQTIKDLEDLHWMQQDMLAHILCDSSYSNRISQFPQRLKSYADPNATDIYRSFLRYFTHNTVPINFTTIRGYRNYVAQLTDIMNVQQQYINAIDLCDSIRRYSDTINKLYGKGYEGIAKAYNKHLSSINLMPTFNRIDESNTFIKNLKEFNTLQHKYIANYHRIKAMQQRGLNIVKNCPKSCNNICMAYQYYEQNENLVPAFTTIAQSEEYDQRLQQYETMQDRYETIIRLRDSIEQTDKRLTTSPNADKVFVNGYRAIKESSSIAVALQTEEETMAAINVLSDFLSTQQFCAKIQRQRDIIAGNDQVLAGYEKQYAHIYNAYKILRNDYVYDTPIATIDDMKKYQRKLFEIASIQERFTNIMQSSQATSINEKMVSVRDLQQIKTLFHL